MDPIITFEQMERMNEIDLNGYANDFSLQSFWHYTNGETLYKIFDKNNAVKSYTLLCNKIKKTNDLEERQRENSDNVFLTCFCNTNSEKIPMWYLYGSLTGRGVSIGITAGNMLKFLKSIDFVYATRDKRCEKVELDSVEIKYGWIYYKKVEKNKTKFYFKRNFYEVADFDEQRNDCYFIKDYVWNYEKEFRIVIIDKQNRNFDNILLPIPEKVAKKMKLKIGENHNMQPRKLPIKEEEIEKSKLKIAMDLLNRNKDEVFDYVRRLSKTEYMLIFS